MMQEQIYNIPYHIIANIFVYIIQMFAIESAVDSKYSHVKTLLIEAPTSLIYIWIMFRLPFFSTIRAFIGLLFIVGVVYPLHKGKWYYVFLIATVTSLVNVLSDAAMIVLIPREMIVSGVLFSKYPLTAYSIYICVVAFMQTLLVLVIHLFRRRYDSLHDRIPWLLFTVFPISQFIILIGTFKGYLVDETSWRPAIVVPILLVCVAADIALYVAVRMLSDRTELRVRNELLQDQLADQQSYYRELSSSFEEIRRMRHDIANHLYTMKALLGEGKAEEAEDYVKEVMKEDQAILRFPECENTVVASYLARKAEEYECKQISFDSDIIMPSELDIANSDLICIFGNILDNAEEACQKTSKSAITLKTRYRSPYLTIYEQNSVVRNNGKRGRRIPELERGLGIRIIQKIAEKYDGEFTVTDGDSIYIIEVILKNKVTE